MSDRETTLRQLTSEFPESPMGWFSLGRYLVEVGRFDEAIEALETAIRKVWDLA